MFTEEIGEYQIISSWEVQRGPLQVQLYLQISGCDLQTFCFIEFPAHMTFTGVQQLLQG